MIGERDGECDQQVDKSEDADELKEPSDLNIPLQIADSLSPSDTPFDTVVNQRRSIHVHVSGSRSKLGKAITNLRRSTKRYRAFMYLPILEFNSQINHILMFL